MLLSKHHELVFEMVASAVWMTVSRMLADAVELRLVTSSSCEGCAEQEWSISMCHTWTSEQVAF